MCSDGALKRPRGLLEKEHFAERQRNKTFEERHVSSSPGPHLQRLQVKLYTSCAAESKVCPLAIGPPSTEGITWYCLGPTQGPELNEGFFVLLDTLGDEDLISEDGLLAPGTLVLKMSLS